ncbi:uncharacterized protein LOC120709535 [Panicum virgatum]|uniref:DUF4220 domain-containing protein n=1 Tax=Panicum virgatum TaxID=38727 RepID=A0A8T0SIQ1_PANVG|nr:uncharacterized protein LOC120709535 [Panicum virgatum]KAG2598401.1 hypothetical protein PVAP13_5KG359000 [Panicum virgatum]
MTSFLQQFYQWEIQLLLLASFTLQVFLLFSGRLRQRSTNTILRLSIWLAYLGADFVAVYALGYLSRHKQDGPTGRQSSMDRSLSEPLAFFWAPFLLIHLGGQDTITAFALEDNNLWLRHLLNLIIQVFLALYVFWKSIDGHNVQLIVPGILLFISGILKYGERTQALMYGNLKGTRSTITGKEEKKATAACSSILSFAVHVAPGIRQLLEGCTVDQISGPSPQAHGKFSESQMLRLVNVELGILYDDLYTKAAVLRTRTGVILRCVSLVSAMASAALFAIVSKQGYSRVDVAITYTLFAGGLFLDVCAMLLMIMASPWAWTWLEAQKQGQCHWVIAGLLHLLPHGTDAENKKSMWSNRMGQYSLASYMGCDDNPTNLSGRVMQVVRKVAKRAGAGEEKLFWLSKLLDRGDAEVDKEIIECFSMNRFDIPTPLMGTSGIPEAERHYSRKWPYLEHLIRGILTACGWDMSSIIVRFHIFTEAHLGKISPDSMARMDPEAPALARACRKLSRYMLYLLVTHPPSMLQVSGSAEALLASYVNKISGYTDKADMLRRAMLGMTHWWGRNPSLDPTPCKETLEEIRDLWVWLVIYTAGRSRPEMHAANLASGGDLLAFVWLLLVHKNRGDLMLNRIEFSNVSPDPRVAPTTGLYAIYFKS